MTLHAHDHEASRGYSLVEMLLAVLLLVTGLLGFASSMVSGQAMRRATVEMVDAGNEVLAITEQFRFECSQGFDAAVTKYAAASFEAITLPGKGKTGGAVMKTDIILDENKLDPKMDIDGNGIETDPSVLPSALQMAVLSVSITWNGMGGTEYSHRAVAYVARGEVSSGSGNGGNTGNGGDTGNGGGEANDPPADPGLTVQSAKLIKSNELAVTFNSATNLQVVAVTVESTKSSFVKEVKFDGDKVFSTKNNLPATGTKITTSPFSVPADVSSVFDRFKFSSSSSGSGSPDMSNSTITVKLHLEDGGSVSFTVDV